MTDSGNANRAVSPVAPETRCWAWRWGARLLIGGLFLGALLVGVRYEDAVVRAIQDLIPPPPPQGQVLYWTSPHDPSVRSDRPGKDPMGMDLVPVSAGQERRVPVTIAPQLEEQDYTSVPVTEGPLARTIQTISTVTYAEPLIHDITLKVDAWLEKLAVDYQGQPVKKGDLLVEVYAPQLVASQQELISSLESLSRAVPSTRADAEENVQLARQRLRYWDVSPDQIEAIERTRQVRKRIAFRSPTTGIVLTRRAVEGKYVAAGEMLYRLADLSRVWVYAYAYPDQIHCVYLGQKASLTVPDLPGRTFAGKVVYIYPYLEPTTRAVKVRLEFTNPDLLLKPDMFTNVALEPHRMGNGLSLPRQAVLDTGMRELVYVVTSTRTFQPREIRTGMELDGNRLEVLTGLRAGERVVLTPAFLLDSESRLRLINSKFLPVPPVMKMSAPEQKLPGMKGHRHHHPD